MAWLRSPVYNKHVWLDLPGILLSFRYLKINKKEQKENTFNYNNFLFYIFEIE